MPVGLTLTLTLTLTLVPTLLPTGIPPVAANSIPTAASSARCPRSSETYESPRIRQRADPLPVAQRPEQRRDLRLCRANIAGARLRHRAHRIRGRAGRAEGQRPGQEGCRDWWS